MKSKRILMSMAIATFSTLASSHSAIAADSCVTDPTATGNPNAFDPLTLRKFNGLNKVANCGAGQTVAIVIGTLGNLQADFAVYSRTYGLPAPTAANFQILRPDGVCSTAGTPLEAHIDVEMVHAFAPQAKIIVACPGDGSLAARARAIQAAINAGASVVSMSWGAPENQGALDILEPIFADASDSVTFVAGSGDSGANLDADGNPRVAYPASSPFVLAVGATQDWGLKDISAWSKSGGGVSQLVGRPDWQSGVTNITDDARLVPDLAVIGDSASPVALYTQGRWVGAAGTSVSAPLVAGMIALANEQKGAPLGDVHDKIYRMFNRGKQNAYFRDVLSGGNDTYTAQPGFDLVTGLGNPRMNILIPFLAKAK